MKRHFILAVLASAVIGLSGCAGFGDKSYGDELKAQGSETAELGKDWNEGERSIERGLDMIKDGNRKIEDGENEKRRGSTMIRDGERLKQNAEEKMRQRDTRLQQE